MKIVYLATAMHAAMGHRVVDTLARGASGIQRSRKERVLDLGLATEGTAGSLQNGERCVRHQGAARLLWSPFPDADVVPSFYRPPGPLLCPCVRAKSRVQYQASSGWTSQDTERWYE